MNELINDIWYNIQETKQRIKSITPNDKIFVLVSPEYRFELISSEGCHFAYDGVKEEIWGYPVITSPHIDTYYVVTEVC